MRSRLESGSTASVDILRYGLIDNHSAARAINALPIALSEGCILFRDVGKDEAVSFNDVRMPKRRLSDNLWVEQMRRWQVQAPAGLGDREIPRIALAADINSIQGKRFK